STAAVEFADEAVADYFDNCVDAGLKPEQFARIWCHTHPADSPLPSMTDEETFQRVFGRCDWALMFIVSRTQRTYARLAFPAGPGGQVLLDVAVDWAAWPSLINGMGDQLAQQMRAWGEEFAQNIHPLPPEPAFAGFSAEAGDWWEYEDYMSLPERGFSELHDLTEEEMLQ